jgi:hypothetical protein
MAAKSSPTQIILSRRRIHGRVDYNSYNYCARCNVKFSKQTIRCAECGCKVRTKPCHHSRLAQFKRIYAYCTFTFKMLPTNKPSMISLISSMPCFSHSLQVTKIHLAIYLQSYSKPQTEIC